AVAERAVKAILAGVIIAFSTYSLVSRRRMGLTNDRLAWVFGFAAGVLGGAYGMNGPPLVIYGALRRWPPEHFRATLQGYFLPAGLMTLVGYRMHGLWTPSVTHAYIISAPSLLPAIFFGRWLNHRLHGDSFLKYVYAGLI